MSTYAVQISNRHEDGQPAGASKQQAKPNKRNNSVSKKIYNIYNHKIVKADTFNEKEDSHKITVMSIYLTFGQLIIKGDELKKIKMALTCRKKDAKSNHSFQDERANSKIKLQFSNIIVITQHR